MKAGKIVTKRSILSKGNFAAVVENEIGSV